MGFQKTCLIGNVGIAHRMGFVESIRSECFPVSPDFVHEVFDILSFFLGAFDEFRIVFAAFYEFAFQFRQQLEFFLPHGFSQSVGLSSGE